jgi:cell wall-associated NlpC family hydrolase
MNKTHKGFLLAVTLAVVIFLVYQLNPGDILPHRFMSPGKKTAPSVPESSDATDNRSDTGPAWQARGAVKAPVTVFWSQPGQLREYDSLILKEENDPAGWAGGMDTAMRLWLVDKADTMAVYGEPVAVLEQRGEWLKVAAEDQKTTLNTLGYPGWVPAAHIVSNDTYLNELKALPNIVVVRPTAGIFLGEDLAESLGEAGYMTRLPLLEEKDRSVMVRLPDGGAGFLKRDDIKKAGELNFSRAGIVEEARKFLGLRYIWAGTASYGFDCSGFTMRLYQSQGITIPRDADEQAKEGSWVARPDLLPGDLVFFAAKGGSGQIHHVGLHIGNGLMIHSPNSDSTVKIQAIDSGSYTGEYWGARRYSD